MTCAVQPETRRHGEDRREEIQIDSQRVICGSRVEIHVRVELLILFDELFDPARNLEPLGSPLDSPSSLDILRKCVARGSSV